MMKWCETAHINLPRSNSQFSIFIRTEVSTLLHYYYSAAQNCFTLLYSLIYLLWCYAPSICRAWFPLVFRLALPSMLVYRRFQKAPSYSTNSQRVLPHFMHYHIDYLLASCNCVCVYLAIILSLLPAFWSCSVLSGRMRWVLHWWIPKPRIFGGFHGHLFMNTGFCSFFFLPLLSQGDIVLKTIICLPSVSEEFAFPVIHCSILFGCFSGT